MEPVYTSEITVKLIDKMGDDTRIAAAAWVSTSAEDGIRKAQEEPEKVPGVINYLMKHRHGTPFEHSCLQLFVHAPIFVWREWHRHRIGISYNEESGRYKQLDPVFYIPPRDRPMMKVENWKPGRPKFLTIEEYMSQDHPTQKTLENSVSIFYNDMINDMKKGYEFEYARYIRQLSRNIDPGLARDCLPVGIYSSCWVTMNPRSCMHFLSLRTYDESAKFVSYPLYEIEVAARKVEEIFKQYWPITHAAFVGNGRVAP